MSLDHAKMCKTFQIIGSLLPHKAFQVMGSLLPHAVSNLIMRTLQQNLDIAPTGSRWLNTDKEDSDWDFFAADTPVIRHLLNTMGFFESHCDVYPDPLTTTVFTALNPRIHVQLVSDFEMKKKAQAIIRGHLLNLHESCRIYHICGDSKKKLEQMLWDVAEKGLLANQ